MQIRLLKTIIYKETIQFSVEQ